MIGKAAKTTGTEAALLHFQIASKLFTLKKWSDALAWYKKIDPASLPESIQPDMIFYQVFNCYYYLKDRREAKKTVDFIRKNYPLSQYIAPMQQMVDLIPQ